MIEKIKQIIEDEKFCVLATAMENHPYCSLMAYAADDACKRLYMVTMTDSEKYRNLMTNDSVSILIDTRGSKKEMPIKALTITGKFSEISEEKTFDTVKGILQKRHPELDTFFNSKLICVFCVEIKSVLFLDGFSRSFFEVFES